jgi:hypothetical protein
MATLRCAAGKTAFLLRLGRERTQRMAVLEKMVVQLKDVEVLLDANAQQTSQLRHMNRLWVAKSMIGVPGQT